jgi:hypothetical protein
VSGIEAHRAAVGRALDAQGLGWDAWPDVVLDARLPPGVRLSAVLLLLATDEGDEPSAGAPLARVTVVGHEEDAFDWLGRARSPWHQLARTTLRWDADTATTAVQAVTARRHYDERRIALALRAARRVCADGQATAGLLDALRACVRRLEAEGDECTDVRELRHLARRVLTSATPPDLLDLSLLVPGDAWAGAARVAASTLPAEEITALVRLLGDLGPRKPSKTWLAAIDAALRPAGARRLLREWLELAAHTDVVPEWPGSVIGDCLGTLFVGTNADTVRAAVWATSRLPQESWPSELLGILARRGAAHNGAPGFPEALALKVASAAVDTLTTRGSEADRRVLVELREDLRRRDLLRKVAAALA